MATTNSLGSSGISSPTPSATSEDTANSERTDFPNSNDRLCSALLWSAKFAFNKEKNNINASQVQQQNQNQKQHRVNWKNPALYKTRLCDYWSTGNPCKFGLNCWFAHGPIELRHVPRLDQNPEATSIALAEVVQCLPPSRDRTLALELAESQLVANIKSGAFVKKTKKDLPSAPRSAPPHLSEVNFFGNLTSNPVSNPTNMLNSYSSTNKLISLANNPVVKAIKRSTVSNVANFNHPMMQSDLMQQELKTPMPRSAYMPYMRDHMPAPIGLGNESQQSHQIPSTQMMGSIGSLSNLSSAASNYFQSQASSCLNSSLASSLLPPNGAQTSNDDGLYRLFADSKPTWSLLNF